MVVDSRFQCFIFNYLCYSFQFRDRPNSRFCLNFGDWNFSLHVFGNFGNQNVTQGFLGGQSMNIVKYKNLFFAFSLIIIIPGAIALSMWGLKVGIDFAGGTLWEIKVTESIDSLKIQEFLSGQGAEVSQVAQTAEDTYLVRLKTTDEETLNNLRTMVDETYGPSEDVRLETVGPTISKELAQKAIVAVLLAIVAIVVYITWAFRQVPKPTSSLAFGVCTVIALLHDVLVLVGVFAFLGHFFAIEVDALFITATLTVIGFSVHDTIVVFDRILENLKRSEERR